MNTLIVCTNRYSNPVPVMPLGACLVAEAVEKEGHSVRLLDLMFEPNPLAALKSRLDEWKPDLVGLSVRNLDNNDMQNPFAFHHELAPIVDVVRSRTQAPILLGGAAVGVLPEALLRHTGASWVALGEGEVLFPELLTSLSNGSLSDEKTPNEVHGLGWLENDLFTTSPKPAPRRFDACLMPDFNRWINVPAYRSHLSTVPIQTKRGCPYRCVYCTYQALEGHSYRLCSAESVVDVVKGLASVGLQDIEFVDNVFNSPYDHALAICEGIARTGLRLHLQSLELNPAFIDDTLLSAMENAGFCGIGITIESASDDVLKRLRKGFTMEDADRAAEVVRRHKLPCIWIFMFGCPGETESTVLETLRFIDRVLRPQDVAFFNTGVRIYPGTELESVARAEDQLKVSPEDMIDPVFYLSPQLSGEWLTKMLQDFMASHMNCLSCNSITLPFLPLIHRIGHRLGVKPPLWKHTRYIRRLLRIFRPDL